MVGVARIELATPAMSTPATHANLRFLVGFQCRSTRFTQPNRVSAIVWVHSEPTDHCLFKIEEKRFCDTGIGRGC